MLSRRISCGLLLLLAISFLATVSADLSFSRTHLVDHFPKQVRSPNAFFFRSNQPNNASHFQYDELVGYMRQRVTERGMEFPDKIRIIDINIAHPLDKGFQEEAEYWENNPAQGEFVWWPLGIAGILRPSLYPEPARRQMIKDTVWQVDRIPERIAWVHERLQAQNNTEVPIAILVHCAAGCDRTGEFIGSYRMRFYGSSVDEMYRLNTEECGRSPNYWGTTALEWYCWTRFYESGRNQGDCDNFAECEYFKHCKPKQQLQPENQIFW